MTASMDKLTRAYLAREWDVLIVKIETLDVEFLELEHEEIQTKRREQSTEAAFRTAQAERIRKRDSGVQTFELRVAAQVAAKEADALSTRVLDLQKKIAESQTRLREIEPAALDTIGTAARQMHEPVIEEIGNLLRKLSAKLDEEKMICECAMAAMARPGRPASGHRIVRYLRPLPFRAVGSLQDPHSGASRWLKEVSQNGYLSRNGAEK